QRLLRALADTFGLLRPPHRIEIYDNSHIQGTNAVGAMIVAGPEGFRKNQYRKFNIRSSDLAPGDDYGMMREVLARRFKRLLAGPPRAAAAPLGELAPPVAAGFAEAPAADLAEPAHDGEDESPWPGLVLIDGGLGQLAAARETLDTLGVRDVPIVAIAKG